MSKEKEMAKKDLAIKAMVNEQVCTIEGLKQKLYEEEQALRSLQLICVHAWVGQGDVHPHGTPRETFICSICLKKEIR